MRTRRPRGDGGAPVRARTESLGAGAGADRLRPALVDGLLAMGLRLADPQLDQCLRYLELLARWNRVYNLTAVRDPAAMVAQHLLDSASIVPFIGAKLAQKELKILDVGSGAGLPGIVLAIIGARPPDCDPPLPGLDVTLLDAVDKKVSFQRQAIGTLGLANARCVHARVESWQGEPFDLVVSRAFATLADFVTLTRHLLAPGGRWFAMKGVLPEDELAQLPAGIAVEDVLPLVVPGLEASRHLIVLRPEPRPASCAESDARAESAAGADPATGVDPAVRTAQRRAD